MIGRLWASTQLQAYKTHLTLNFVVKLAQVLLAFALSYSFSAGQSSSKKTNPYLMDLPEEAPADKPMSEELKRIIDEGVPKIDSQESIFTASGESWGSLSGNFFKASPKFELTGLTYKYADFDAIKNYAPKLVFNFDDAFRPQIFNYGKDNSTLAEAHGGASAGRRFQESIYSMNTLGYMNSGNYELFNLQYSAMSPKTSRYRALPQEKQKSSTPPRKKPEVEEPILTGNPFPGVALFLTFGFFAVIPFVIKGWLDNRKHRRTRKKRLRI